MEVGTVEGSGIHECTSPSHNEPFRTTSLKEWEAHKLEKGHYQLGEAPCIRCDNPVKMSLTENKTPVGKKPLCPDCKQELLKGE